MSGLRTSPLLCTAPSADFPAVSVAGTWTFGAWVEVLSATSSSSAAIAGVVVGNASYTQMECEVDIGVGTVGNETSIGIVRLDGPNSGNGPGSIFMLRTAIGGISSGARIAVRLRSAAGSFPFGTCGLGLLYYESFDSSLVVTDYLTAAPLAADSATITPNGTAWTNSSWVTVNSGDALASRVMGIAINNVPSNVDTEWDIGTGATPTVVSTLRTGTNVNHIGRLWYVLLPALLPVGSGTVVSVRMRKTGTATNTQQVGLLYFLGSPPAPPSITVTKTHTGSFYQGQQNATFTITYSNIGAGDTVGTQTVTDTLPSGLTLVSMAGTGWTCVANVCSRSDTLASGASYPPITVTVTVGTTATTPQVNQANDAFDTVTILPKLGYRYVMMVPRP